MDDDGIQVIGANEDLFDEEDRILNKPITGGEAQSDDLVLRVDQQTGEQILPTPSRKRDAPTSASMAKAMREKKREEERVGPAYTAVEAAIFRGIVESGEDSVIVDLGRYDLNESDLGKIKDAYASKGWKIEVGAEPFALTFSL